MSSESSILLNRAEELRVAQKALLTATLVRDQSKVSLNDAQSAILVARTEDGTIDGKNAELREAQAILAYRQDLAWQAIKDTYVETERAYQIARSEYEWAKTALAVQAIVVNLAIAESGSSKLLAEVSLASV